MDTKKYLNQINELKNKIKWTLTEIKQLKEIACNTTIPTDREYIKTSTSKDKIGNVVTKIVDMQNEKNKIANELIDKMQDIISKIDEMQNTNLAHILHLKYVEGKKNEDISKEINYSRPQTIRLFNKALEEFEILYGQEYLNI